MIKLDGIAPGRLAGRVSPLSPAHPRGHLVHRAVGSTAGFLAAKARLLRAGALRMRLRPVGEALLWIEAALGSLVSWSRHAQPRSGSQSSESLASPPSEVTSKNEKQSISIGPGAILDATLWLTAAGGLCAIAVTVLATFTGMRPVIIRSGSMEPAIQTGAVIISEKVPANHLNTGDIVTITRPDRVRITHRIHEIRMIGTRAEVVLKGDANAAPDIEPVRIDHAYRFIGQVPKAAWISALAATPGGGFALGVIVSSALMIPRARALTKRRRDNR